MNGFIPEDYWDRWKNKWFVLPEDGWQANFIVYVIHHFKWDYKRANEFIRWVDKPPKSEIYSHIDLTNMIFQHMVVQAKIFQEYL